MFSTIVIIKYMCCNIYFMVLKTGTFLKTVFDTSGRKKYDVKQTFNNGVLVSAIKTDLGKSPVQLIKQSPISTSISYAKDIQPYTKEHYDYQMQTGISKANPEDFYVSKKENSTDMLGNIKDFFNKTFGSVIPFPGGNLDINLRNLTGLTGGETMPSTFDVISGNKSAFDTSKESTTDIKNYVIVGLGAIAAVLILTSILKR